MALSSSQPISVEHFHEVERELVSLFLAHKKRQYGLKASEVTDQVDYGKRKVGRVLKNSQHFSKVATRRYKLERDLK